MAETQVTVLALIRALPGKEEEVKAALLALVLPTRRESGCLNYDLHQSSADSTRFMFYENWESRAALDAHLAAPHLARFREEIKDMLAAPVEITRWEKTG